MSTPTNENTGAEGAAQGESFIDRMEAEYHELDAKLNKAVDFVKTDVHAALHPDYQHLLQQQINGMSQYLHALAARLLHHGRGVTLPTVAMDPATPGADKTVAVTVEAGVVTNVGGACFGCRVHHFSEDDPAGGGGECYLCGEPRFVLDE